MPATEFLCQIVGINPLKLSKGENVFVGNRIVLSNLL